jgi:hypothetical protein
VNRSKRMINGRHLKAALGPVPGPGLRALPAEIMRHLLFPGRVGPTGLGSPGWFSAPGRNDRRSHDRPTSSCGSRSEPPGKGLTRPMLSAGNALDPGPRPKLPENVNPVLDTGPPVEPRFYPEEITIRHSPALGMQGAGAEACPCIPRFRSPS